MSEGEYGEYESVRFDGDETFPRLLMLPSGCHVLAPLQLTDGPFQTEFGAELPPGESFGWQVTVRASLTYTLDLLAFQLAFFKQRLTRRL